MMRLALASAVLALAAAAHAAPHAQLHAKAAPPAKVVRVTIVSGSGQTARAYVAPAEKSYVTEFPGLLVVRMDGVPPGEPRHVRFVCVTKSGKFDAADQPNAGEGINHAEDGSYGVETVKGTASLRVAIKAAVVGGTYTVRAEPVVRKGERGVPAFFTLTTR